MISGLELLAYSPTGFGTETALRPGWDVAELARLGADGAKVVVFHRAELAEVTASQHRLIADLVAQCAATQVPLIVEPLWYPLDGESLDDPVVREARVEAIIDGARTFAELGADVLKVEFPGYLSPAEDAARAEESCHRLDEAIGAKPWVLLSASATFEIFRDQLAIAARAGACGFMAGRAIWGDSVGRFERDRLEAGARTAAARLRELGDALREHGRGWQSPVPVAETVSRFPRGWYEHH
jgi:tagatose-1,6-bisphosphate aldolase